MIPIRIYRYIVSTFVYFDNSRKEILLLKLKRKILVNLVMSCVTYLLVIAILVFWRLTARRRITERSVGL